MPSSLLAAFLLSVFLIFPADVHANKLHDRFRLRNGVKNPCYEEEWTVKGVSECLQEQIEAYYGSYFTAICPSFALTIADWQCEGCPWATINSTTIYESKMWENRDMLGRDEMLKYFPKAKPSCAISEQALVYRDYYKIEERIFGLSSLGGMMLIFGISALSVGKKQVTLLGRNVPEPLFLLTIIIIINVAYLLIYAANDFYLLCESPSTVLSLQAPDEVSYAIVTLLYLRRCGHLEIPDVYDDYQSWHSFITSEKLLYKHPKKTFIAKLFYCLAPVFVLLAFIFQNFRVTNLSRPELEQPMCVAGMATKLSHSLIQLSKLSLELLSVTIYGFGPSKNRCFFYVRYFTLASLIVIALAVLVIQTDPQIWNPNSVTQTIVRVMDYDLASPYVEIVLTVVVCSMGLLEPLRIGWPQRDGFEKDPPSLNWRRFTFGHPVDM